MAVRSYMSRREVEQETFHPAMALLAPLGSIIVQVMLPKLWAPLASLDLPLIVTLFFAVSRRSPIAGTVTGASIGLLQDVLTSQKIGVNGLAKTLIGYAAASLGSQIDVENTATRALLTFGFALLQDLLLYIIQRWLLGAPDLHMRGLHWLLWAAINTAVAVPLYLLLDRGKLKE
jgi:rod shape-determining protein MreD